jgi:hypothetical protein
MKTYTFYTDPAHGWIKVPMTDLKEIAGNISSYSYYRSGYAYLEEDSDAQKFLAIAGEVKFKEVNSSRMSAIRNYDFYDARKATKGKQHEN